MNCRESQMVETRGDCGSTTRTSTVAGSLLVLALLCVSFAEKTPDRAEGDAKMTVIVARATDGSGQRSGEWFGVLAAEQMKFRLTSSPDIQVVESRGGKRVGAAEYRALARKLGASFVILQSYELLKDEKSVHYYAEVVAAEGQAPFAPIERTFAIESMGAEIDACALAFSKAAGLTVDAGLQRFYNIPAITIPGKDLKLFGADAAKEPFVSAEEAASVAVRHKVIIDNDARNLLAHYLAARAFIAARDHDQGGRVLRDLITVIPNHAGLYLDACRSFRLAGLYQQALEVAALAEKQKLTNTPVLCEGAEALLALGRVDRATRAYETVLSRDPSEPRALMFFARKYNKEQDGVRAADYAARLTKETPDDGEAHFELGKAHMALGDCVKAIDAFERSLKLAPTTDVYYLLGLCHDKAEAYPRAIDAYKRFLSAHKDHENALQRLVEDYLKIGDKVSAAEHSLTLYEADRSGRRDRLASAAFMLEEAGQVERAGELYSEFVKTGWLENSQVNIHLARIEFGRGQHDMVTRLLSGLDRAALREPELMAMLSDSYCALNRYSEAIPWLRDRVAIDPGNTGTMRTLAEAYEKTTSYDLAIETYHRLLTIEADAHRPDYALRIGELYEAHGDHDQSVKVYRDNIARFPSDIRNYDRLARAHIGAGEWAEARTLLIEMINFAASDPRYRKMLAEVCARQNDRAAAIRGYREYLDIEADDVEAWKALGDIHFEKQMYARAAESYARTVELASGDFHANYRLGLCLVSTGDAVAGVSALRRAHRADPKSMEALDALAKACRLTHDTENLVFALRQMRMLSADAFEVRAELGRIMLAQGKVSDAVVVLEEGARLRPESAAIHVELARAYEGMGNENARFSHLKAGLKAEPDNGDVNLELGELFHARGTLTKAGEYLTRAMEVDRDRAEVRYAYARLLLDNGLKAEAFEHARWAARNASYDARYLLLLARAAQAVGKQDLALATVAGALAIDTSDLELLSFAGALYKEAGDIDNARRLLLRAVAGGSRCGECHALLGEIFLGENLYTRAAGYLRKALELKGYDEKVAIALGRSLQKSMEEQEALRVFEQVLSHNATQPEAMYRLVHQAVRNRDTKRANELVRRHGTGNKTVWHHLAEGEMQESVDAMDRAMISYGVALRLDGECSDAMAGFGRVNLSRGEWEDAIANIGKALVKDPYNPFLMVDLGKAYEGMGEAEGAAEIYKEVVRNYPTLSDAYSCLAGVLSRTENSRKAIAVINEGLSRCPQCPDLYMALGREYQATAKHDDAIKAYHEAVRKGGKRYADAYLHIATVYGHGLSDDKAAQKYFRKYLKAGGSKEEVRKQMATVGQ